jgi:thioredoxin-dependent peroxiredoxin
MSNLSVGASAPDFEVMDHHGKRVTLADFLGTRLVIYFYPKDDTSGCTIEAQEFTYHAKAFEAAGCKVVGVSKDSVASHCKFMAKHNLTVTLLSDEGGKMCEDYGVWVQKSMYGKHYMGIERTTFLIDEKGMIRHIWNKVSVKDHAENVLAAAQAIGG